MSDTNDEFGFDRWEEDRALLEAWLQERAAEGSEEARTLRKVLDSSYVDQARVAALNPLAMQLIAAQEALDEEKGDRAARSAAAILRGMPTRQGRPAIDRGADARAFMLLVYGGVEPIAAVHQLAQQRVVTAKTMRTYLLKARPRFQRELAALESTEPPAHPWLLEMTRRIVTALDLIPRTADL